MESLNLTLYAFVFILSLISSAMLVPVLREVAFKYSIIDIPNQAHKTHQGGIPYLGGLAIIIPVSFCLLTGMFVLTQNSEQRVVLMLTLFSSLVLAIMGLIDDVNNLNVMPRLIIQLLVSSTIAVLMFDLGYNVTLSESKIVNFLISIFWLIGITNAFNFFDNLDGGVAGISVISSLTVSVLASLTNQHLIALLSLSIAGACFGFLMWNKTPAKIFLGDSGALFIGFLLALLLLQFQPEIDSTISSGLFPLFILALPIIDTCVAVISRLKKGSAIYSGGRDHLSHRLLALGLNKRKTVLFLWGLACLFSTLAILVNYCEGNAELWIALFGLLFMVVCIFSFLKIENVGT